MIEDEPTVIGITGMKRSGTTTQFNICRIACEKAGYLVWAGGPAPDAMDAIFQTDHDVYIVKEHRFFPRLANLCNYVFTAERSREEVKRSMEDFRGWTPTDDDIAKWEGWLEKWRWCSTYHMPFNILDYYPRGVIQKHRDALGINVSVHGIANELAMCLQTPTENRQDPHSLVFEDHYTSRDPNELAKKLK